MFTNLESVSSSHRTCYQLTKPVTNSESGMAISQSPSSNPRFRVDCFHSIPRPAAFLSPTFYLPNPASAAHRLDHINLLCKNPDLSIPRRISNPPHLHPSTKQTSHHIIYCFSTVPNTSALLQLLALGTASPRIFASLNPTAFNAMYKSPFFH